MKDSRSTNVKGQAPPNPSFEPTAWVADSPHGDSTQPFGTYIRQVVPRGVMVSAFHPRCVLVLALFVGPAFAGCVGEPDSKDQPRREGEVLILPEDRWTYIGDRETSIEITSTLEAAVNAGTLGCVPFERAAFAPREPMWIFHWLSSFNCRDQNMESWSLLKGYANGSASADEVFTTQDESLSGLRREAFEALNDSTAGNLVGYHVVARMQEMFADAERQARDAASEFGRARAAGDFAHSEANATRLHAIVVDQLAAQHLFDTITQVSDLIGENIASGSNCSTNDVAAGLPSAAEAAQVLATHEDAIENGSTIDLAFALGDPLYDLQEAVVHLRFAEEVGWSSLAVRAASQVALFDGALARVAPDPDFRMAEGEQILDGATRARINATINEIVVAGVDPWGHEQVDWAIRVLSPQEPGLQVGLEPTMETLLALEGRAVRDPCATS